MPENVSGTSNKKLSDRVGFGCSSLLLGLVFVLAAFAVEGLFSRQEGASAVTGLILLIGPIVIGFFSFVCWIVLYLNSCRLRYHVSWGIALIICLIVGLAVEVFLK